MNTNIFYLFLSVFLSSGRNIFSKKNAVSNKDISQFFFSQASLFLSASLLLIPLCLINFSGISKITFMYGIVYGILLVLSQWMFTLSLKKGSTSICSVIYSLGFLLPTLSGIVFWNEEFAFCDLIGLLIAIVIILLSMKKESNQNRTITPLIIVAMLSSGGLGIMQKLQQKNPFAEQKNEFLTIAFLFAFLCSFLAFFNSKHKIKIEIKSAAYPLLTGLCFGGANLFNTILAGKMKSAIFFPLQNISTIIFSSILGILIFKEKITLKTIFIIILGAATIIFFSI